MGNPVASPQRVKITLKTKIAVSCRHHRQAFTSLLLLSQEKIFHFSTELYLWSLHQTFSFHFIVWKSILRNIFILWITNTFFKNSSCSYFCEGCVLSIFSNIFFNLPKNLLIILSFLSVLSFSTHFCK